MELSGNKRIALIAGVAVVVVIIIVAFFVVSNSGNKGGGQSGSPGQAGTSPSSSASSGPVTRLPVPANVVVPDAGAANVPADVAVPTVESAAAPGSSLKYRSFNIIVENGAFMPSTIAVNLGDEVNLQLGAVGGDYDFTQPDYGFHVVLPNGKSEHFEFGATAAGKFVFYCSSCGGPAKGPVGYLIVTGQ